jgi:xanthine dehydrogenase accessory factor
MGRVPLIEFLSLDAPMVLVEITSIKGSSPRDSGTIMLVSKDELWGTIGGGQLEYLAIDEARRMLFTGSEAELMDVPLGPEIGQCCGGRCAISLHSVDAYLKQILIEKAKRETESQPEIYIFGSGHVGKALAEALTLLPVQVTVIESRAQELIGLSEKAKAVLNVVPESVGPSIPKGSAVVILTHDHAQDFLIGAECLKRNDLAYVGMIGSDTKRATFFSFLKREGYALEATQRLTMPIGDKALTDKRPEMIAAMVVPQLLLSLQAFEQKSDDQAELLSNQKLISGA